MKKKILRVFSRHPSHNPLREKRILLPALTALRLGSETEGILKYDVEINSVAAIKNSASKLLMKNCFKEQSVRTAVWIFPKNAEDVTDFVNEVEFPIVMKRHNGSRNEGNTLIRTSEQLSQWLVNNTLSRFIVEKYHPYQREYRLHVTTEGCFYTCRKVLKLDTPDDKKWFRNDSNSNWVKEDHELFNKPSNWDDIVSESVKALTSVGLDIGAIDVRVSNEKREGAPSFIILETNSAPSFGEVTLERYLSIIPKIVQNKLSKK
jgi:glutathione synthase/RimK-type ligase-like ATP-grasp enzyme